MSDHKTGDVQGHREEMPAQEGAPVQEKAPAQEGVPTREKVPALEEISTWEVAPAREVAPSQEGVPTREEAHRAAPCVSGRQRVVLAVLALCFMALIAVCGFALATDGGAPALGGVAVQGSAALRAPEDDAAASEDASAEDDEAAVTPSGVDDSSSSNASDQSGDSAGSGASDQSSSNGGDRDTSDSSSSHGGSSGASQGESQQKTVTVSVSIDSSAADGSVSGSGTFTFKEGATPYDALCALRSDVTSSSTAMGIYVEGIGGLFENDSRYPGVSGWKYMVNGQVVMQSAGSYTLSDGDHVTWYYTVTG